MEFTFDSHAHIDAEQFAEDRDAMLARAQAAGVATLLAIGTGPGPAKLDAALPYAELHDWIFTTVGIHPHDAKEVTERHLETLATLARHRKVIAWGRNRSRLLLRPFSPRYSGEGVP